MVLSCNREPVSSGLTSEISPKKVSINSKKNEMTDASAYCTLPRVSRLVRRKVNDASMPVKYLTDPGKQMSTKAPKKSFFTGLANKLRFAVDGKPSSHMQRSPSEDITGSTGNLQRQYALAPQSKILERPTRLWARGLDAYGSQRRLPTWRKPSSKKASAKENNLHDFTSGASSASSTPASSAPSSPESQRSFQPGTAKRARRSGYTPGSVRFADNTFTKENFRSPTEENKKSTGTKILVVGAEGVGKSALTVRFLTKRFIGEYAPEIENVYDHTISLEGKDVPIHMWDSAIPYMNQNSNDDDDVQSDGSTMSQSSSLVSVASSGESTSSCRLSNRFSNSSLEEETPAHSNNNNNNGVSKKNRLRHTINRTIRRFRNGEGSDTDDEVVTSSPRIISEAERRMKWADGIVVVYSICDQSTLEAAHDVIRYVRQTEMADMCRSGAIGDLTSCRIPILLLGNKADLAHRRRVDSNRAQKLASSYGCSFIELSVSERYEPTSDALCEHLKVARKVAKLRDAFKSKCRKNKS